jgi:hypothetical protein
MLSNVRINSVMRRWIRVALNGVIAAMKKRKKRRKNEKEQEARVQKLENED